MDTQKVQGIEESEVNNVTAGEFPLSQSPVTYQLTIHVNNMLAQYGKQSTAAFKAALFNPELLSEASDMDFRVNQIINHYGIEVVQSWFNLIYGWEFKAAA